MSSEKYENLIIGSGEGGKFIAWHLAKLGQKTAVVERKWIGGSCPNINCLPSKNEIWSAKVADLFHHAQKFGVVVGSVAVDMAGVLKRKRAMVDGLVAMHLEKYKTSGAELIMGEAKFTGFNTVEVQLNDGGTRPLGAQRVFLNLGTNATIPPTPGLSDSKPLTHIQMLELDRLPEHLIVIGGGYVGLEFAQAYRRFGSRVTIIQRGPQILADKDPDIAAAVLKFITGEGIDVITSADIVSVTGRSGIEVQIIVRAAGADKTIAGSDILVAAGRTPNTSGIGLESAGVELDAQGFIKVNHRLEATAPNVWAIGECAGSPQFTHVSYDDYRVIRDNLAGGNRSTRDRLIPSCLFTDPPVAQIGLSEAEAKRLGVAVRVTTMPINSVLRTRTLDETEGFIKVLLGASDNKILGFTMIGPEAGEVLAVVQTAINAGQPFTKLRDAIFTHPTMAEGLNVLFSGVAEMPQTGN